MTRLKGKELLEKIRQLGSITRDELVRQTGYVRHRKDGSQPLDLAAFTDALLAAQREATAPDVEEHPEEPSTAASQTPSSGADVQPQEGPGTDGEPGEPSAADEISRSLVKTVIALPLLDRFKEEKQKIEAGSTASAVVYDVIIDFSRYYPGGRKEGREWIEKTINTLIEQSRSKPKDKAESVQVNKSNYTRQYLFARLSEHTIRELVLQDGAMNSKRAIFQIWEDFKLEPLIYDTVSTLKADAARTAFRAEGKDIVWAVIDSGIDGGHDHFKMHRNLEGEVAKWHADFTGEEDPLLDGFGHGTHVAGIIAGELPALSPADQEAVPNPRIKAYTRSLKADGDQTTREVTCDPLPLPSICGMAPKTKLVSLKVIDKNQNGAVSNIIAALAHIQTINANGRFLHIHGVNLSVGYSFNAEWFACGQSQLCVEVNRLVRSGVVVVVAAGNTGYGIVSTAFNKGRKSGLDLSINDPGNAEGAITVGATHRTMPHVYGVSYFSSKGPTGDGRSKPDLVAPGEKVVSCGTGSMADAIANKVPDQDRPNYVEDSGTSMAAPHVSGAAAALLSVKNEFIGEPERVKRILMDTATDLGRERQFQGAGLVDLMRAIQSI